MLMVSPITVRQWAQKGLLRAMTTVGGHRRFLSLDVKRFAEKRGLAFQPLEGDCLRLLVVNDDHQFLNYLAELFLGYAGKIIFKTAKDGFQAGWKIQDFSPHVVLLDLTMPGIDGLEIIQRLKGDPVTRAVQVIAITGLCSKDTQKRILSAGAETCLTKPIDSPLLLKLLGLSIYTPA